MKRLVVENGKCGTGKKHPAVAVSCVSLLLASIIGRGLYAGDPNIIPKTPSTQAVGSPLLGDSGATSLIWVQKFTILDYKNKNVGYVNIELARLPTRDRPRAYRVNIRTKSSLPFWFFSGKSITDETEYYDEKFVPLWFELELDSEKEKVVMTGQRADGDAKQRRLDLRWKSEKKEKSARLPLVNNICTGGSVRSIILRNDVRKRQQYELQLLDKYKLAYQKVKVSTGDTTMMDNTVCYRIDLQLGLLGRFAFVVDQDGNIIEGKGAGIRLAPVR